MPDWSELTPFSGDGMRYPSADNNFEWTIFFDMVQDDLSFTGIKHPYGYWKCRAPSSWDAHNNPVYPSTGQGFLNDSILQARGEFNENQKNGNSTGPNPCPSCYGLPPTHGGNELATEMSSRCTLRFTDPSHTHAVGCCGDMGGPTPVSGCFSQDSCPQWKLVWYDKVGNDWKVKWRVGKASISKATGSGQFDNIKGYSDSGLGGQPMSVNEQIENVVSVNDMVMSPHYSSVVSSFVL